MFIYLGVTLFVAVLGLVYESFAHGVFSAFMMFGFVIPLVFGLVPYTLLFFFNKETNPSEIVSDLYNAGVATLTLASLYKGVLDIYGTTRYLHLGILSISGTTLILAGITIYLVTFILRKRNSNR